MLDVGLQTVGSAVAISGHVDQAYDPNLDDQPTARSFDLELVRFEPFQVCIYI